MITRIDSRTDSAIGNIVMTDANRAVPIMHADLAALVEALRNARVVVEQSCRDATMMDLPSLIELRDEIDAALAKVTS